MLDLSLVRSGQRDDRETLVESGCDLLEGEIMLLADSDTIGTESANKLLYLKPMIRIWIALLEEFVEAGIGMEGVQDCGTCSIAAGVRFNLAIALNVQRAYVVGTWIPKGIRDQTNARRSGKGIKGLRGVLGEVKHRCSEIYNGRIEASKGKYPAACAADFYSLFSSCGDSRSSACSLSERDSPLSAAAVNSIHVQTTTNPRR